MFVTSQGPVQGRFQRAIEDRADKTLRVVRHSVRQLEPPCGLEAGRDSAGP